MYADLHLHTFFSDGTYTPEELAEHGHRCGLKVMSLTDHDTIDGCERMAAACAENNIEFITGCEFTVEHEASSCICWVTFLIPTMFGCGVSWRVFRKSASSAFMKWWGGCNGPA